MNLDNRKVYAIKNMNLLWLGNDIIEDFKNGKFTFFNRSGYPEPLFDTSYTFKKLKEIEIKFHCTVYAVIYSDHGYGSCYNFLFIPEESDDLPYLIMPNGYLRQFICYAYVWNRSFPELSEFGTVLVHAPGKQLKRLS